MSRSTTDYNPDLPDNEHDKERLKPEETTINLPDVEDIPGQENIKPAPMGELADDTISSADEEGEGLWPEEDDDDLNGDTAITNTEATLLDNAGTAIPDDENLSRSTLDDTDDEGESLNEASSDRSGSDLDVPGSEADDRNEEIGEEDEKNNAYSIDDNEGS